MNTNRPGRHRRSLRDASRRPPTAAAVRALAAILFLVSPCLVLLSPASPAHAQPLIVAMEPQASAAPLAVAAERGWFVEEGLDVQLVPFHANQTMVMALAEGDIDIALVDLSADTFAMAAARNLRVIAAAELLDAAHPRHAWLVAGGDAAAGLEGFAALGSDAVFGLTEPGAVAHYLLARRAPDLAAVAAFAVEGSDVALAAALAQGRVQAALLPAHLALDLEATEAATIVDWAGAPEGPVLMSALLTSAAQASLRPEVMQRFLRAYVRGLRAYRESILTELDADDVYLAAERDALVRVVAAAARRPERELLAAPPYFALDGRVPERSFTDQLRWWQQAGVCPENIEPAALIDSRPLDAALAALAEEAAAAEASAAAAAAAEAAAEPLADADTADGDGSEDSTGEAAALPADPAAAGGP